MVGYLLQQRLLPSSYTAEENYTPSFNNINWHVLPGQERPHFPAPCMMKLKDQMFCRSSADHHHCREFMRATAMSCPKGIFDCVSPHILFLTFFLCSLIWCYLVHSKFLHRSSVSCSIIPFVNPNWKPVFKWNGLIYLPKSYLDFYLLFPFNCIILILCDDLHRLLSVFSSYAESISLHVNMCSIKNIHSTESLGIITVIS